MAIIAGIAIISLTFLVFFSLLLQIPKIINAHSINSIHELSPVIQEMAANSLAPLQKATGLGIIQVAPLSGRNS